VPYRVTIRRGPSVERGRAETLEAALDALEDAARDIGRRRHAEPVDLRFRTYAPGEQVVGRVELAGPTRLAPAVRAGVDVRGDGAMTAYVGRARRAPVEERDDESALQALRRALTTP
jgi:hypothetical protein